jgi:hypothetical protein
MARRARLPPAQSLWRRESPNTLKHRLKSPPEQRGRNLSRCSAPRYNARQRQNQEKNKRHRYSILPPKRA